jgi:hypothetical protein
VIEPHVGIMRSHRSLTMRNVRISCWVILPVRDRRLHAECAPRPRPDDTREEADTQHEDGVGNHDRELPKRQVTLEPGHFGFDRTYERDEGAAGNDAEPHLPRAPVRITVRRRFRNRSPNLTSHPPSGSSRPRWQRREEEKT